jgi:hypothetical protein
VSRASELTDKGIAEYARGLPEEAERLWSDALAVDPGCERARSYLEQLRARPPGPAPAADGRTDSRGGFTPPPKDPARFSVPPEKLVPVHRPTLPLAARRTLLVAGTATALVAAIAVGLYAKSDTLVALPGEAVRIVKLLRAARVPDPVASIPPVEVVPSGPSRQRGAGREGRKSLASGSRSAGSGQTAIATVPPSLTMAQALLGTRWGMSVEEVLTVLPSASRTASPARSGERGRTVEARADGVELCGQAFRAEFLFDASRGLGAVRIRSIPGGAAEAAHDCLRAGLVAELGEPSPDQPVSPSTGTGITRSSWETSRGGVDLEFRKLGVNEAPVLLVDMRGGNVRPVGDASVALTLAAPGSP